MLIRNPWFKSIMKPLRPTLWELACVAAFGTFTVHAGRNSVWLICLVAAPAACGLGERFLPGFVPSRRTLSTQKADSARISSTFASSDGWSLKNSRLIQRCDPRVVEPTPKTRTINAIATP